MKTILKKAISGSARVLPLDLLIRLSGRRLLLPFYHMVSDDDPVHIRHLYPAVTVSRFNADLDFFLKWYTPVSAGTLIDRVKNNRPATENSFYLSFDDGFREFHDIAAPILLKRGIPATCFVNSAFIGNKEMFFRLKASILIDRILAKPLSPGQTKAIGEILALEKIPFDSASDLLKITYRNREVLDRIAPFVEVSFSGYLSKHQPYLTTDQINALIRQGFTIGAHSVSHPYYYMLPEEEQVRETLDCIRFLADNFSVKERLFSFPFTDFQVRRSFFDKIGKDVDLTFGTASLKLDTVKTNLQRTAMEKFGSGSAEAIVKPEYLYFILKRLAGKHMIRRD
jgi:peptidoglycan/xylan/chitin deacetylase (PgdA/CDA1 family)